MILDTNAISGLLAGDCGLEEVLHAEERHHLPVIVLGEYRYGLSVSRHGRRLESLLDRLEIESSVLAIDASTARDYADIRRELRAKGRPIPEKDLWIAALARQHHLPLVSRDAHFDAIDGLQRFDW